MVEGGAYESQLGGAGGSMVATAWGVLEPAAQLLSGAVVQLHEEVGPLRVGPRGLGLQGRQSST